MEVVAGRDNAIIVRLDLEAAWAVSGGARRYEDFAPPNQPVKPVLYVPVKKHRGSPTFPPLGIRVGLVERRMRALNYEVPGLAGAEVLVCVRNVCRVGGQAAHRDTLRGHLDGMLRVMIEVNGDTLGRWLDPAGPFQARVNEALLDFDVSVPSLTCSGRPLAGTSLNRVFLYRRKTLVFLPGVFGSQFKVQTSTGSRPGYPVWREAKWQDISHLECDAAGVPLLPAAEPKLLSLLLLETALPPLLRSSPVTLPLLLFEAQIREWLYENIKIPILDLELDQRVYNLFANLRRARRALLPPGVPDRPVLLELQILAYDWRSDLTATSRQILGTLRDLQARLRREDDTDDEIALAGHSTGGLLIRRMLADTEQSLLSHCFFLNVPFAGAPKALSVLLTGRETPGGAPMIPIITPESLAFVAPAAPIVYHLAPSAAYPRPWVELPAPSAAAASPGAALVEAASRVGIYSTPQLVKPDTAPPLREATALSAARWRAFQQNLASWSRALPLYRKALPGCAPFMGWPEHALWDAQLRAQAAVREPLGWNPRLAEAAAAFHRESVRAAAGGAWAAKCYVFYSGHEASPGDARSTPGVLKVWRISEERFDRLDEMLKKISGRDDFPGGMARPATRLVDGHLEAEEWAVEGGYAIRWWGLSCSQVPGDGTVPKDSLLAFGGPANVFPKLPGGPNHTKAPNNEKLWDWIVRVLQGHDVTASLERRSGAAAPGRVRPGE